MSEQHLKDFDQRFQNVVARMRFTRVEVLPDVLDRANPRSGLDPADVHPSGGSEVPYQTGALLTDTDVRRC